MRSTLARRKLFRGNAGFTLLETMIAMAIMVIAFTSILSVESSSINASAKAREMNVVAMLAKNKMVEVEYKLEGRAFDEVKKEDSGAFDAPFENYRWQETIKEIKFPNLSIAGGKKEGPGASGSSTDVLELLTKLITNFLSKAVREVTVTVFWKRGSSEQSFSVSTYWVDLNHEFELSE